MATSYGFEQRAAFAEYLDARMEQHQQWRHEVEYAMLEEILDEVQGLPPRNPKPGRLFLELPEHLREMRQ